MSHETLINDVSDTSFWVAYFRARETERTDALFQDRFAKVLVGERGKPISDSLADVSRYTEWAVVSRTVIIDRFIQQLVKEGVDAVINLGAGLDARPYRMDLPESLEWIEVDYPNIIKHKSQVLENEKPRCKLTRLEADLADSQQRKTLFASVVPHAQKVLILTEGVIPYLSPEQVSDLSRDLRTQQRFTYWITEYLHPKVYFYLKQTVRKMKNAPFRFYPDDWFGFFKSLGWIKKDIRYSGEIAVEFNRKTPMPKWAALFVRFLPQKVKEESLRMTGYVIFEHSK